MSEYGIREHYRDMGWSMLFASIAWLGLGIWVICIADGRGDAYAGAALLVASSVLWEVISIAAFMESKKH